MYIVLSIQYLLTVGHQIFSLLSRTSTFLHFSNTDVEEDIGHIYSQSKARFIVRNFSDNFLRKQKITGLAPDCLTTNPH